MATMTFFLKAPLVFVAARTCRLSLHSMFLAFGRFICLRRKRSVSALGMLLFFLCWLARRSVFDRFFRPPSAYSASRLKER